MGKGLIISNKKTKRTHKKRRTKVIVSFPWHILYYFVFNFFRFASFIVSIVISVNLHVQILCIFSVVRIFIGFSAGTNTTITQFT